MSGLGWVSLVAGVVWTVAAVAYMRMRGLVRRFVRCEDCHCTRAEPCLPFDGCAWNPAYLKLDRYICTACRPIGEGP